MVVIDAYPVGTMIGDCSACVQHIRNLMVLHSLLTIYDAYSTPAPVLYIQYRIDIDGCSIYYISSIIYELLRHYFFSCTAARNLPRRDRLHIRSLNNTLPPPYHQ